MLRVLDIFSGIGGFTLGLEAAGGFETVAFCENDSRCQEILKRHWPNVPIITDARSEDIRNIQADMVAGGDPCPIRSQARFGKPSIQPDLAGYFLAVVGSVRPLWVVRENVRSPDVKDFAAGLEVLGYRSIVLHMDARDFTGQSRPREFVVGCSGNRVSGFKRALYHRALSHKHGCADAPLQPTLYCLTTSPTRGLAEDNYILEAGCGIRRLSSEEREAAQGFPEDWTEGFSWTARSKMTGNAVVPQVVEVIGRAILEGEHDRT